MVSLNHIGIAVKDLPQLSKLFNLLKLNVDHTEPVPAQGVITHFIPLPAAASGKPSRLELLETIDPEGVVAKFIQKKGPGIHHLAFEVGQGELEYLSEKLKKEGYRLIYDRSQSGAHGMKVNFIHPGSAGGILIELTEPG